MNKTSIKTSHLVFKNTDKNGLAKIYVEASLNGRQKRFPTSVKIKREICPNKKGLKVADLIKLLQPIEYQNVHNVEQKVDTIITTWNIKYSDRPLSIAGIEKEFFGVHQVQQDQDIFLYYKEFLRIKGAGNHNTYLTHSRTHDLFNKFINTIKNTKKIKTFEDITHSILDQFRIFLETYKGNKNPDGMQIKSVNTRMEKLRDFIKYYFKDKKHNNTIFSEYKFKRTVREEDEFIVTLTKEEFKAFEDFNFSSTKRLERIRDYFLLQTRLGMRYEDFITLNHTMYKIMPEGKIQIDFLQAKTKKRVCYNIHPRAYSLFNKLIINTPKKSIKKISNKHYNDYLKEALSHVAETCPTLSESVTKNKKIGTNIIQENRHKYDWIGTHTARRTFINFALEDGLPPKSIIKFTGHSSLEILNVYINKHQGEDEALQKLNF